MPADTKKNAAANPAEGSFIRPRINRILEQAAENPLTIVCAGKGYGKTRAVSDFINSKKISAIWMKISEADNARPVFWEDYSLAISRFDENAGKKIHEFGFPDTDEKLKQFLCFHKQIMLNRPFTFVLDDFHMLRDPGTLRFLERHIYGLPENSRAVLICRDLPRVNLLNPQIEGLAGGVYESELNFTENEIRQYLIRQGLSVDSDIPRIIAQDTNGWAFAVNLIARSLEKSLGYLGYVRNAFRRNMFCLMESEAWDAISEPLKRFLAGISIIGHFSADLIDRMADGDERLLLELRNLNAYVRYDNFAGVYIIHHVFLDFLRTKPDILSESEQKRIHKTAADWCGQNGFMADALCYFEKADDYGSIVSVLLGRRPAIPDDLARSAIGIFERAPEGTFRRVEYFAAAHVYILLCLGRWRDFFRMVEFYEQKFISLPEDSVFRDHALAGLYYFWGSARLLMSTYEDAYDFDAYYEKMAECMMKAPVEPPSGLIVFEGAWISAAGSSRRGAPKDFIDACARTSKRAEGCLNGSACLEDLTLGELYFYQGEILAAETALFKSLACAKTNRRFEAVHRALFYIMRLSVYQGARAKAEQALKDMEAMLNESGYAPRFDNYDIALGWYYYCLRRPEMTPDWLKAAFSPYAHAYFAANYGNQMKARYHYLMNDYPPLLAYIDEMRNRESILYGRVEMLAIEACVWYKAHDKAKAYAVLKEAYDTASPNNIVMPFIELGKDARNLTAAALRDEERGIPAVWLKTINSKSAIYVKHQELIISDFTKGDEKKIKLTAHESEILQDLYHGLARHEIASKHGLSINTVKAIIRNIFTKMKANNVVDVIRVAVENKLV